MFRVEELAVAVGDRVLVSQLSFTLLQGERVAIVGPSGVGKSSLLRVLAALSDPIAGRMKLDDRSPAQWGFPAWRRRVAYVAQQPVLCGDTVRDNLERLLKYATGRNGSLVPESEWRHWLVELGLGGQESAKAERLSVGEQQRVALVRALALQPRVLLLDEPTSALDAERAELVEHWLAKRIETTRAAALLITHDRTQAERWCDHVMEWQGSEIRAALTERSRGR